jgi:general nucleoside transport system permease protein
VKSLIARFAPALLALAVGAIAVLLAKGNPVQAYAAVVEGALGSVSGVAETLAQTTVFIFAGLSVAIAFRCGLFNIGAEGQLIAGALSAAVVGAQLHAAPFLEIIACLTAGGLGGALWASIAGVLRARFGASEVITTIMLNYIAALGANYLVAGPLQGSPSAPETTAIDTAAVLHPLLAGTRLTIALPLALGAAALLWWWLGHTAAGFQLRVVGRSERVARYAGVSVSGVIIKTMAMAGALAGLGGAFEVLALFHRFNAQLSPGYGFTSIAVALLARSNPLGVIASGLFFGVLTNGALSMQALAGVPRDLVSILEGLAILFVALPWLGTQLALHERMPADTSAADGARS